MKWFTGKKPKVQEIDTKSDQAKIIYLSHALLAMREIAIEMAERAKDYAPDVPRKRLIDIEFNRKIKKYQGPGINLRIEG